MLCFVALFVFAILSIFSAKYRPFAARAFHCVIYKMTLRPCESGLDEEIKAKSVAGIMKFSPSIAIYTNKHFEAISFAFTILAIASLIFTVQGIWNFAVYGNCNGPSGGFCIYSCIQNPLFLKAPTSLNGMALGTNSSNITVIEFGCYTCPYTKAAEASIQATLQQYGDRIYYVYKPFPLPNHPYSHETVMAASCANDEGKYWEYRAALFENQANIAAGGIPVLKDIAHNLSLTNFNSCFDSGKYLPLVDQATQECADSGLYGTPTFFVNGKAFVGQTAANDTRAEIERLIASG